jgi:uncharacterized protein (TIGR00730 family)
VPRPDRPLAVCVFCAAADDIDARYVALAADVGTAIAARGWTLVSGGGSVSAMGAVARAARAGGAHTVGVIPRQLAQVEVSDHDADELIVTDDMRERKGIMDASSDAFLALPGGLGTLEELLEVWVARTLRMHEKPVVAVDPDGLFAPLREQVDALVAARFVRPEARDALRWTSGVGEALDAIEELVARPALATPTSAETLESEP